MAETYAEKQGEVSRSSETRVALDSIIDAFRSGRSAEAIQDALPALSLSPVYGAIAFYLDHRAERDEYLAQSGTAEARFCEEVAPLSPKGVALKARLKQILPREWR